MKISELYEKLKNDRLGLAYQGIMSDDLTDRFIQLSETNFDTQEVSPKISNKVSFLMFECFQNVVRHGLDKGYYGNFFLTRNLPSVSYITSANLVANNKIEQLKEIISDLNNLTKEELKERYLSSLAAGEFSDKGGAGLGLIEMARKSGNKLDFDFVPWKNETSHFFLSINMKTNKKNESIPDDEQIQLNEIIDLQKKLVENGIIMAFKNNFSEQNIVPILKMMESNLNESEDLAKNRKLIYSIIELSQNISKHACQIEGYRDGLLAIGIENNQFFVSTSNLINKNDEDNLRQKLEKINHLIPNEIEQHYLTALQESVHNKEQKSAGIGLIDLANITKENYSFEFSPDNNSMKLFTISIKI
ncbi:MAG: hypothetical protein C0594_08530 [Marinilabiliales bacterium]|nr:MAG: hypothetical protein C0594_08530 [Marinilabiliales bacterium]